METFERVAWGPGLLVDWSGRGNQSEDSGRSPLRQIIEKVLILCLILGFFAVDWESFIFRDSTLPVHSGQPEIHLALSAR